MPDQRARRRGPRFRHLSLMRSDDTACHDGGFVLQSFFIGLPGCPTELGSGGEKADEFGFPILNDIGWRGALNKSIFGEVVSEKRAIPVGLASAESDAFCDAEQVEGGGVESVQSFIADFGLEAVA